jgi:hypothetical protein
MPILSMEEYSNYNDSRTEYMIREMREVIKERISLSDILKNTPILDEFVGLCFIKILDRKIRSVNENMVIIEYYDVKNGKVVYEEQVIVYNYETTNE